MAKHRAEMRARGYRPIQIWVPDTRSEEFRAEVKRQMVLIDQADHEDDIMEWLDSSRAEWWDDEG
ncbi:antitoxin MazE family protein [Nesterenkonia alkaliphila]|uniref:antitoxin MazE family protein n=1 Tax=Nesterenkonia alkaliphila TaxID=1463631 RepID=UPI002F26464C